MGKKTESILEQDGYVLAHTNMDGTAAEPAFVKIDDPEIPVAQMKDSDMISVEIPYGSRHLFAEFEKHYGEFVEFMQNWGNMSESEQQIFKDIVANGGKPTIDEIKSLLAVRKGEAVVIPFDEVVTAADEPAPIMYLGSDGFSKLLAEQQQWSLNTFGPAPRTAGVLDHITKEIGEVRNEPYDLMEWIDLCVLAIDGFWRHGGNPSMFVTLYERKLRKNFARVWPDWRKLSEDQAIEHDRSHD